MAVRHLLLVSEEPATTGAVAAALESNGRLAKEDVCRNLPELIAHLEKAVAPAALVDIDANPSGMLLELEPIVRRFADTKFIVLCKEIRPELMLEAMQIGARHFMVKQSIAETLRSMLHRLCNNGEVREPQGSAVTVLSAGGGCGATTIAVNLAHELCAGNAGPVLLADLDHFYGGVGAYHGLEAEHGMFDLLARSGPIDAELVHTTTLSVSDQLKVLASASTATLGEVTPNHHRLGEALDACRRAYPWAVLDAPRLPLEALAELAKASALTLLTFQLSVKDIRMARAMVSSLIARGVPAESMVAVVTRYRRRGNMVELEEAKRVLNRVRIECFSNDFAAVSQAVNFGEPLSKSSPRSALRKEIQDLASKILDGSLARARQLVTA